MKDMKKLRSDVLGALCSTSRHKLIIGERRCGKTLLAAFEAAERDQDAGILYIGPNLAGFSEEYLNLCSPDSQAIRKYGLHRLSKGLRLSDDEVLNKIRGTRLHLAILEDVDQYNIQQAEQVIEEILPYLIDYAGTFIVTAQLPLVIPRGSVLRMFDMFGLTTKFNLGV
jgi:predicted AAA+ superfamily ATPase